MMKRLFRRPSHRMQRDHSFGRPFFLPRRLLLRLPPPSRGNDKRDSSASIFRRVASTRSANCSAVSASYARTRTQSVAKTATPRATETIPPRLTSTFPQSIPITRKDTPYLEHTKPYPTFSRLRCPKIADPILTCVDPSSIAISKSPLMPIERISASA